MRHPSQYTSTQTIALATVGTILSVSAAVSLVGCGATELLELRRAKRIP